MISVKLKYTKLTTLPQILYSYVHRQTQLYQERKDVTETERGTADPFLFYDTCLGVIRKQILTTCWPAVMSTFCFSPTPIRCSGCGSMHVPF